jgi:iron complex outermembrane receptor protein
MYSGSGKDVNNFFNLSGYAQFENNLFKTLTLSVGIRLEYYNMNGDESDFQPIFRAGMNLKLAKETFIRLSYGQGYRFPTIAERYIRTFVGVSFGVFENPLLKPERSWNAEIGIKQGFKFLNYFGYFDMAIFQQEYRNTIEYLFGFWDTAYSTINGAGFKFVNTGDSRIYGVDISVTGAAHLADNITLKTILGYNYIMPITLDPDYVYAVDIEDTQYSYESTSLDPSDNILKYRFLHTLKGDLELNVYKFSAGMSVKFFSKMENLDKSIEEFENTTQTLYENGGAVQPIYYMNYYYTQNTGQWIIDARLRYEINNHHEISLLSNNLLNNIYSLRPLKAEPMRTITVQYIYNF